MVLMFRVWSNCSHGSSDWTEVWLAYWVTWLALKSPRVSLLPLSLYQKNNQAKKPILIFNWIWSSWILVSTKFKTFNLVKIIAVVLFKRNNKVIRFGTSNKRVSSSEVSLLDPSFCNGNLDWVTMEEELDRNMSNTLSLERKVPPFEPRRGPPFFFLFFCNNSKRQSLWPSVIHLWRKKGPIVNF